MARKKRFVIVTPDGPHYEGALKAAERIAAVLVYNGAEVSFNDTKARCDLAISVGGDGTMMHTVSSFSPRGIPTIGINAGDVGFLTSGDVSDWEGHIERILKGDYEVEKRIALLVRYKRKYSGPFANDVVLKHPTSVAYFNVEINGHLFYEYIAADGVILATPTGSTAYNVSVGGPVILPSSSNVVLSMISPMRVSSVPVVLEELAKGGKVRVTVIETKRGTQVNAQGDAQHIGVLDVDDSIVMTAFPKPILFANFGLGSYITALHEKKGFAR